MATIAYPISKLDEYSYPSKIDESTISTLLMELVVDEYGNGVYSNKKATFQSFGDYLISSHPIFNKIDEIYNDRTIIDQDEQTGETIYRYRADIYLSGQTYFERNPLAYDTQKLYTDLNLHQTVQKRQIEQFVHDNGLEIEPIGNDFKCVYAMKNGTNTNWLEAPKNPYMTEDLRNIVPFFENVSTTNCFEINGYINDGKLVGTDVISFRNNQNRFVTVVGKVKVPVEISTSPYYTPELNLWAATYDEDSRGIVAITELHNYRNVGSTYYAYFSMQFPIAINQKIRIVIPFMPANSETISETQSFDVFGKIPINSVCLFYYSK